MESSLQCNSIRELDTRSNAIKEKLLNNNKRIKNRN